MLEVAVDGQGLPAPRMTTERSGVSIASELRQASHRVDIVAAVHLDQQVLAVGAHPRLLMSGESSQVTLEFVGACLGQ